MKLPTKSPAPLKCSRFLITALSLILLSGCSQQVDRLSYKDALDKGWNYFQVGEFKQSEIYFNHALKAAGDDHQKQTDALYAIGMTYGFRRPNENISEAKTYFERVLEMDPRGDLAPWCLLAEARLLALVPVGTEVNVPELRKAYQAVVDQFPLHPAGEEAFLYQQITYVETTKPEDSKAALPKLESFLATHRDSKYASQAEALVADCYWFLGDQEQRLKHTILSSELAENNPESPRDNSAIYLRIASIAQYELGDLEVARKYYNRFLNENRTDKRRFNAKLALKQIDEIEALAKGPHRKES